jgi:hypothetical protein
MNKQAIARLDMRSLQPRRCVMREKNRSINVRPNLKRKKYGRVEVGLSADDFVAISSILFRE